MAKKEGEEKQRSYKDLKKKAKKQVKAQKKEKKTNKKKNKAERKYLKQEAKLRRKGIYPMDAASEEEGEIIEAEEFVPSEWVRKSTEDIPYVEKKIDLMADRREDSSLHQLFEEKYGESLVVPETFKEYELSDAEKRRLEAIRAITDEPEVPAEAAPVQAMAPGQVEAAVEEEGDEAPAKSFWNIKQLWLYSNYGKDKMIILKIIILLFSVGLWPITTLIRIIYLIVTLPIRILKKRKAKKAAAET
jgi:hypothetical protein